MILASAAPMLGDIHRLRGLGQQGQQVIWILGTDTYVWALGWCGRGESIDKD